MRVTILYLAAGNSRRFGENKLLYPLDGKAVYRHLLDRLAQIAGRHENWELLVVTQYERILEELGAAGKSRASADGGFRRTAKKEFPIQSARESRRRRSKMPMPVRVLWRISRT